MLTFLIAHRRAAFTVFACVAMGLLAIDPTWSRAAAEWISPLMSEEEIDAPTHTDAELDEMREETQRRIEVKESIIANLIAKRMTLSEATDRFMLLNERRPDFLAAIRATYPGHTDREKMARNVIAFIQSRTTPGQREILLRELEDELNRMENSSGAE